MSGRTKYTAEVLAAAAKQSASIAGVLRLLGVRQSGGSHAHVSRQLKRFHIDTSHFTGKAHNRGDRGVWNMPPQERLTQLAEGALRVPGKRLRVALVQIGLPEQCEKCGCGTSWNGRPLTLHVDHINGNFLDNRPRNLRFLCPNCHSQTATYANSRRTGGQDDDEVVYDDEAVTPTGLPLGRRLPPRQVGR
ncbi:HNH endonuclease signature motif containing protein [Actinoplanes sp. NPDC023801]|uniref:HNH endonuclease signature motif containing protein n=1 Tax=Actinoplanes sp. NPDC023801 TaxID=3154595 RepID=UPI0033E4B9BA